MKEGPRVDLQNSAAAVAARGQEQPGRHRGNHLLPERTTRQLETEIEAEPKQCWF